MHSDLFHQRFEARFSDGRTARSREVTVELNERGIAILHQPDEPLIWPYGALATAEPLTDHAIDALVTYSYQPGATLFVQGPRFARALAKLAPQLTASAERWRSASPWLWGAAATIALGCIVWLAELSPARTIAALLPDKARAAMGRQAVASMSEGRAFCDDTTGTKALGKLTQRLATATQIDRPFKVVVIDWGLVNAFATPGENVVLTRGLLEAAEGPDEIAGVLAHEMGHGIELHPETGLVRAMGLAAATELLMGGSGGALGNIGIVLLQLSYSREAEGQADDHAISILRAARVSSRGFAQFFERMSKRDGTPGGSLGKGGLGGMLSSHPETGERLAKVHAAGGYDATPALTKADWTALQGICASTSPDDRQSGPAADKPQ
ncbi:MAG: M48 family metallopeptidase [Alphaproteobacteria bacterium]|nr:M48 family metallopeptidase [Alphaproteobacteria bacterium]